MNLCRHQYRREDGGHAGEAFCTVLDSGKLHAGQTDPEGGHAGVPDEATASELTGSAVVLLGKEKHRRLVLFGVTENNI